MSKKLLVLFILFGICSCKKNPVSKDKVILIEPVLLGSEGNDIFQYWDIDKTDNTFILTVDEGLKAYIDSLVIILGKQNLQKIISLEKSNKGAKRIQRKGLPDGAIKNYQLSHSKEVGEIRAINYLESQILNYQVSRFPLLSHPTEFHAFILANDSLQKLRICYAGGDKTWPPRPSTIFDHMKEAAVDGWYLKTHLHNHFEPDSANYLGLLAPSMSDAQYFKMLRDEHNIATTLITNGFHTLVMDSLHFDKFAAHN